jgi:hypothetical protein
MPKWEKQGSKPSEKRKRKDTVGWTDGINFTSVGAIVGRVGTKGETLGTADEPTVHYLVASDELQRKSKEDSSTGWSDCLSGDTVGLSDAQFEFIQRRTKTKPSAPDDLTPWSRWSVGLSDGRLEAKRGDLDAGSSAPDDPTHRRCIASEQLCQRTSTAKWRGRGTGWTDALENIVSDHPTVPFSVDISQRLVWCLNLFIPPPLTHLRLLDCVEV